MRTYLDHAGTTPVHPQVASAMNDLLRNNFGNPSSIHSYGREAYQLLNQARKIIAQSLNVFDDEIIFTSGGTEADNMAIISTALSRQKFGKHLITTSIEHPAVLNSFKFLEKYFGFRVTYLPVDQFGNFDLAELKRVLNDETILVSIMFANNEIGNLMPIREVGKLLASHQALFHTDAVQAYGVLDLSPKELGIDLLSASAHKFNGPKGCGFLYQRRDLYLEPFLHGGEQELGRRSGTENLAGIVGMATAVKILTTEKKKLYFQKYQELERFLLNTLRDYQIDFRFNGNLNHKLPQIVNLQIVGIDNALLLTRLDLAGIAVSAGSACTAGNISPSHVLKAMNKTSALQESVRISFGYENTKEDLLLLVQKIKEIVKDKVA